MTLALGIAFVGLLIFLAHLFSVFFEKSRVPDVLPLVFLGFVLGPIAGIIPKEYFGQMGEIFATVTLVIILFQSGLELDLSVVGKSIAIGAKINIISFIFSFIAVTGFSYFVINFPFIESMLVGSILACISPAVAIPILRKLNISDQTKTILSVEAVFGEVLCVVTTIVLLQVLKSEQLNPGVLAGSILASIVLAVFVGILAAFFWSTVLKKVRKLENAVFLTPAFVLIIFGIVEFLGYSGAISAFAFGIVLGNAQQFEPGILKKFTLFKPIRFYESEKAFFSEIVFILKTFFFLYIGISFKLTDLHIILMSAIIALIIVIVRIPVIFAAVSKNVNIFDVSIMSANIPRGLVAAVLAALPLHYGAVHGETIQDIIYTVILFSIFLSSILVFLIEKQGFFSPYNFIYGAYSKAAPETKATETK